MLSIIENPKGWYNLYNEVTGEGITGLHLDELDVIRRMIEGIYVAKMPEPKREPNSHVAEPFRSMLNEFGGRN